jgi:SAM-dependent methyltransferase
MIPAITPNILFVPPNHYDGDYFSWQRAMGEFSATASRHFFAPFIRKSDAVIDFGCGGGFLLAALDCRDRIGVEVNPAARAVAKECLPVVGDLGEIADEWADVVISNHALEHVSDPFEKLKLMVAKQKPGGLAIFVVPCERYDTPYVEGNIDQHLFTWSPVNLGNLFHHAGLTVLSCERIAHRWPPRAAQVQRLLGWPIFHGLCRIYAHVNARMTQIRVVARKPTLPQA